MRILILILFSMSQLLFSSQHLLSQETFGHPVNGTYIIGNCYYGDNCVTSSSHHTGVDYSLSNGTDILASATGKVAYIIKWEDQYYDNNHGMGSTVILEHRLSTGGHKYSSYSHLDSVNPDLYEGQVINKGDMVGIMGASGYGCQTWWCSDNGACTGYVGCGNTHLHFEIKDGNTLANPSGPSSPPQYGYTPSNPDYYGYNDPLSYINSVEVIPHPDLIYPSNNASNIPASVTLDWSGISGANNYRIQIKKATDSGWTAEDGFLNGNGTTSSVVVNQTTGYNSELSTNLTSNETYYWTVRVANPNAHSYYSPPQSFTTSSSSYPTAPNAPNLYQPSNNGTNVSIPVSFDWSNVSGAEYRIQVSTSNSGWSPSDGFTLSSYCNSTVLVNKNTGTTSSFVWNLPDATYICDSPQENTTYYWTVRSFVAGSGTSDYTPPQAFTTAPPAVPIPPNAPSLYQPLWNATNVSIPVSFDWSSISGGAEYRIQVSTSTSGWSASEGFSNSSYCNSTVLVNKNTGTISSFTWNSPDGTYICDSPQENTTYYWTVRSYVAGSGTSNYTPPQAFTTIPPPPPNAPNLYQPLNNATNESIPVSFDWSTISGGAEYRIQVSTSNSGWSASNGFTSSTNCNSTVVVNANTYTTSSFTWGATLGTDICTTPQENTIYYWTVRSYVAGSGTSDYTYPRVFTTEQIGCSNTVNIFDNVYASQSDYQEASNILNASNTIYNNGLAEYRAGNKVVLKAGFEALAGSDFKAFIAPCTIPKSDGELPENDSFIKEEGEGFIIYPNPANDHLFVSFDATTKGDIILEIYDLTGKKLKEINRSVSVGINNLEVDIQDFSNGVYIIQLSDGIKTQSSKLVIQ